MQPKSGIFGEKFNDEGRKNGFFTAEASRRNKSRTDPFAGKYSGINGIWEVVGTAGGIHGGGYPPDFELLLVKPNAIFGIVRNDSLLASGKIEIQSDTLSDLLVHFIPGDSLPPTIQILWDYEKYLIVKSDTLVLFSPCCDRYDTILKKVE